MLTMLLSQIKKTLKKDDISDVNRTMLSTLVEELLWKFDADNKVSI
jgi:hypothetical protein